ncbi:hypothetical protein THAOC_12700 [Thalassiosira oceanica]|uniref:Uncharacterized protein n=1 Tax=Thalassiosira oceanica TaxID=159749 RepID=K0SZB2_THAOC|nr:hypothetical protein THAOC_12700 [Thalassiosira oceanica]|eukprot:EJK66386.1 hypothetical protein THAOC_12700 [Thalassiosira oceanica]
MTQVKDDHIKREDTLKMFYNLPNIRTTIAVRQLSFIGKAVRKSMILQTFAPTRLVITACCNHKRSSVRPQLHNKDTLASNLQIGLSMLKQDASVWEELIQCMLDPQRELPARPNWGSRDSSNRGVNSQSNSSSQRREQSSPRQERAGRRSPPRASREEEPTRRQWDPEGVGRNLFDSFGVLGLGLDATAMDVKTAYRMMTNAASDVELELPGSVDGGRTDSFHGESAHYERKAKIVKCGCLVAVAGVSATLGSWASGAFSKSASDVHAQSSAALYQKSTKSEERQQANGFEAMHSKRFLPWEWLDPEPEPEPPAPSPSCEPDLTSNVCYGYYYYRLVSASDIGEDPTSTRIPWTSFFTATIPGGPLENCVLAPVTSARDGNEIIAAAGLERYAWVGIKKSAQHVKNNNGGNGSRNNWYNLDGTSVPNHAYYWVSGKPDNRVGLQTYGAVDTELEGLDDVENYRPPDINPDFVINKAVMKCCAKGYIPQTFCTAG